MGKNMEAPERIRVAQDEDGFWTCREAISGSQEYIRADLATPSATAEGQRIADKIRKVAAQLSAERMQGWANPLVSVLVDAANYLEQAQPKSVGGDAVLSAPSAPAEVDGLVKALRSGQQSDMDGTFVKVSRQACKEAATAIEAYHAALAAKDAEIARLAGERQALAEAICGGEDFPGLLDATSVEHLVDTARKAHRAHSGTIDRAERAEAALAESEAKRGAILEQAAEVAGRYASDDCSALSAEMKILDLDTEATASLAAYVKQAVEAETRACAEIPYDPKYGNDWMGMTCAILARLDQRKEAGA